MSILKTGLNLLKKLVKFSFDNNGFPKSRSIKQLCFYLKYFILIREWFKESQSEIPDFINENIYYLGQAYAFTWQNNKIDLLFNGNNETNNINFDHYLKKHLDIVLETKVTNWEDTQILITKRFHLSWTLDQVLIKSFLQIIKQEHYHLK